MARDKTPEEFVETHLYHAGVEHSGDLAASIIETLREERLLVENSAMPITPTEGALDDKQHMAFILRIFMYYVELTPMKKLTVDLEQVLKLTKGRQMQVRLDGARFEARTIKAPEMPDRPNLLM